MNLLILFIGIIIGILIAGSIFTYITIKNDGERGKVTKDMQNYIEDLERENIDLKTRNKRLKEALRKT